MGRTYLITLQVFQFRVQNNFMIVQILKMLGLSSHTSCLILLCASFIYSFDRDWKKIEAFIGSKTVIQVHLLFPYEFTSNTISYTTENLYKGEWINGRFVVMHKNTFSRFKKVVQMNISLLLVQKEKLLIHIHKKLQKTVSKSQFFLFNHIISTLKLMIFSTLNSSSALKCHIIISIFWIFTNKSFYTGKEHHHGNW